MRISDWSSDVCSSDLSALAFFSVLPAQKASAEAALAEAEIDLAKMVVYAGVDGTVEQFTLREGDVVARIARPAGVLIRSEEHTSELQSLMRISYAVFCLKKTH